MLGHELILLSSAGEVPPERRQLAAIMFTDMVGYTALSQKNEALAMQLLEEHRNLVRQFLPMHNGREVKTVGDAFLVEFASALEAVRCAFAIQQSLHELNLDRAAERKILLRIGVHLGDVIHSKNDVYGDAVNVASRIEPIARPGGICVTYQVYDSTRNKVEFPFVEIGEKMLKNVQLPVKIYEAKLPWEGDTEQQEGSLDRRRVAVMPLINMVSDPNEQYFADGMTEELISAVSKVRELSVISRTSAMHYKNQSKRATEIAQELKVGTLLEGSVRKAGNRVRISVQLIDAQSDKHLWAENYDRTLEDVFAIQSEIASRVAEELRIQLLDFERRMLERRATENTEAYTNFLEGRELFRKGDEVSLRGAVRLFERAIELDPSFARAYSQLADCYLRLGNVGYEPYHESIAKAKTPLKRALDLDPNLAEAHATSSTMLFNEDDLLGAEAEARRAIELNPSLPEAYSALCNVLLSKGRGGESVRLVETYYRLDPIRPEYIVDLGMAYFYSGRESEALEHWNKTSELAPAGTYRLMAEYYLWKGDLEKAKQLHSTVEELDPNNPWVSWMRGFIAARTGDQDAALLAIRKIDESKVGALGLNSIGFIYYALGDLDSYFSYISRALDLHALDVANVMYCPLFADARADPRYRAMREKAKKMFWPDEK
jgi:adenylate cyclase